MPTLRKKVSGKNKIDTFGRIVLFAADFLGRVIGATLDAIENEFLIKSDVSDSESNKLSNMTRAIEIKKHKTRILQSFHDEFTRTFTNNVSAQNEISNPNDFGLSLMDEAEIQENLLIDNLAYRVADRYQPSLHAITKGIVRISSELDNHPEPDALSPARVGSTFQKAIECLRLPFAYKPLIYNTLSNVAFGKLQELYTGILTLLIEANIISTTESPVVGNPELLTQYKTQRIQDNTPEDTVTSEMDDDDPNDYTISDMTTSDGSLDAKLAELMQHSESAKIISHKPVPIDKIHPELFERDTSTQLLYKLITHKSLNPTCKGFLSANLPEVTFLLSELQTTQLINNTDADPVRAISHAVDAALDSMGADIKRQISDVEYNIIQIINRCFIAILDDNLLPEPVKLQVRHLQIPYIKAALLDITLLINEDHPCRLFLDEIASLGVGATETSFTEYAHIKAAIQHLAEHFKSDLKIFKDSRKKLHKIKKVTEEKAQLREHKYLPSLQKQATRLFRKSLVSRVLREALREKQFPNALHTLTLKGFTKILDRRYLNTGLYSTEFQEALKLFCQIVESVQPIDSIEELHQVFERIPRMLAKTRTMLNEIYSKSSTRALLSGLESFYLEKARSFKEKLDRQGSEPELKIQDDSVCLFDANSDAIFKRSLAAVPSSTKILAKCPPYIKTGAWFDIYISQDTRLHRLKLIAILEDSAQLIFLGKNGKDILIQNITELIKQIDCERSRKLDVYHLFDKALAAAITNTQLSQS